MNVFLMGMFANGTSWIIFGYRHRTNNYTTSGNSMVVMFCMNSVVIVVRPGRGTLYVNVIYAG